MHIMPIFGALLLVFLSNSTFSQIASSMARQAELKSQIDEANRVAKSIRASVDEKYRYLSLGTGNAGIDLSKHRCYALGFLLELEEEVRHLRFDRSFDQGVRGLEESFDVLLRAHSLDNFANAAATALEMSPGQRRISWNIDCSGRHGIRPRPIAQSGPQTFYEVVDDGLGIKILGSIESGFASNLRVALEKNPSVKFVALGSGGGAISEAIAAGRLIPSKKLSTTVFSSCFSACPLVFIGGVERYILSPYPSLGFHQLYARINDVPVPFPPNSVVYKRVAEYVSQMGASEQFVISAMLSANPYEMSTFSGDDGRLCEAKVATWVQRMCAGAR